MDLFIRTGFSLVVLFAAKLIAEIVKPAFKYLDDWVDKYWKIDLPEYTHLALEKIIGGFVWVFAVAVIFVIWGYVNPLVSDWFQFFSLVIFGNAISGASVPFIKGLDEVITSEKFSKHKRKLFQKAFHYLIWTFVIIGSLYIFNLAELFTAALAGAGFAGIVIGFAAKDTFGNLIAGIAVILDKSFKIGDVIEVNGIIGEVDEIALRSTTIKGFDNKIITVPNAILANNPIINYTKEKVRRLEIPVGVSYDTDLDKAIKVIKKTISSIEGVVDGNRPIDVIVDNFGDFSVNLSVRFWVETKAGLLSRKSLAVEKIKRAFEKEGIEIPFPTRVMLNKKNSKRKKK